MTAVAPEQLRGDLIIFAVEIKFIGETEDDEIKIGEVVNAEIFFAEIASDASVADETAFELRLREECLTAPSPEQLRGDLIIFAVDFKLIGETEDDEIKIGEVVNAEIFFAEIPSNADIADETAFELCLRGECVTAVAPEQLRGDLIIFAVDFKLIGETEDDKIKIGEVVNAEIFFAEIASDAGIADGETLIVDAVIREVEPKFFRLIAMKIRRLLDDDR